MADHRKVLDDLAGKGRLRSLTAMGGRDFTSNDYLGLAQSDALAEAVRAALARGVPVGAGGSRLLRGNHPEHEALEAEAAEFFHSEAALFFPTGFAANAAIAATLPRRGEGGKVKSRKQAIAIGLSEARKEGKKVPKKKKGGGKKKKKGGRKKKKS